VTRRWPVFVAGAGGRVEKRIEDLRNARIMRRPIAWISEGSVGRFVLAAILTNAIIAVTAAHVVGTPVDRRRIVFASAAFAAMSCGLHTVFGSLIGYIIRAVS
jgi:hypothetical protein